MTTLNILSKEEIERFESPPWFTAEKRKYFFTIPDWAENTVKKFSTPASKIGFILQLGYFRATNKFYPKNLFCPQDLEFVQKRLGFENIWRETEYSARMMQRHRLLILTKLNYKVFSPGATPALFAEAASMVEKQLRLKDIFDQLLEWLEQKQIEVPHYHALSAIITRAFRQYEKRMLKQLETYLTETDKKLLDTLLTVDEKIYESSDKQAVTLKRPRVTLLKKFHQSTRPGKIKANISDLLLIKKFFTRFEPVCQKLQLSTQVIEHYATITIKVQNFQIERRNEQRYLYLLCFISHQYYTLQDMLIETLLKVAQTATNNAKKVQQETYFAARDNRLREANELMEACESADTIVEKVKHIVLSETIPAEEKLSKLKALLQKNREYSSKETRQLVSLQRNEQKRAAMNADYFDSLQAQSLKLQNRASEIVKYLGFNEDTSQKSIMAAITYFQKTDGKISSSAPTACFSEEERHAVSGGKKGFRVSLYKALLFKHIAKSMKSGGLNLKHSYVHRSLGEYMISEVLWKKNKAEYLKRAELEEFADFPAVMQKLKNVLDKQYETTNMHILDGTNQYLAFHKDHDFTITTPRLEDPESGIELFPQTSFVSLCEVLTTMNQLTHFLDPFVPAQLTHTLQRPPDKVFFAAIIALGRNLGIPKMSRISKHISQSELERAVLLYFSPDNISRGSDATLSFLDRLPLTHIFDRKDGIRVSASDGQKYTVGVESLIASRSYKFFGRDQGLTEYLFRDYRDFLYHSTIFSPTDREAWYMIDGIMHNIVVKSDWHTTDTHGVTPLTFAAMHCLGVFFAPRIANMQKRTLYSFVKRRTYKEKGYKILPDKPVNEATMQEQWDNILRFMATIILREATASQLFQRLNSNAHKHPLYRGLKEFGQIIETIYILRNVDEVEIRQVGEKERNKLEHINRFSKAVFDDDNHVFRQETREGQLIAENCKRLIQNNIIGYNYLIVSQKVLDTPDGKQREALLAQIKRSSMAAWHHIYMDGEYDFSDERVNTITRFPLSKILGLKLTQKQEG